LAPSPAPTLIYEDGTILYFTSFCHTIPKQTVTCFSCNFVRKESKKTKLNWVANKRVHYFAIQYDSWDTMPQKNILEKT